MSQPRFPLPRFPTGWFQVAWSDELPENKATPLKAFGQDLVMFRDTSGQVKVLDAFCPHMGAHLGHGGEVNDGEVVCPFHAWRFDGEGQCTSIPYSDKVPKKAKLACWPVSEVNGAIMVWHDIDKQAPTWEVPVIPEFTSDLWSEHRHRKWTIRTHNQEMAENMVDTAHFKYLHGTANFPDATVEARGPVLHMRAETVMTTRGGHVSGQIEAIAHGLGFSLNHFTGVVETLLMGNVIPVDEQFCDVRFTFTIKKVGGHEMTKGIGDAFVNEIGRQLEQDIPVWENKIYIDPPMLCAGDGPVGLFRRWSKQFYPQWYFDQARENFRVSAGHPVTAG